MVSANAKTNISDLTVSELVEILSQVGLGVGVPGSGSAAPAQASAPAVDEHTNSEGISGNRGQVSAQSDPDSDRRALNLERRQARLAAVEDAVNQTMALRNSLREWEALEPIPDGMLVGAHPSPFDVRTRQAGSEAPASAPASTPASAPASAPAGADTAADGAADVTSEAGSATAGANGVTCFNCGAFNSMRARGEAFYVVTVGTRVGVLRSWIATQPHVSGIRGASFCRYSSEAQANAIFNEALEAGNVRIVDAYGGLIHVVRPGDEY